MFPVNFKKERAEYFLSCLNTGELMEHDPEQPGWTVNEMLQLAGACFFAMLSHGPLLKVAMAEMRGTKYEPPDDHEHREALDEGLFNDVHAAVEFAAHMTQMVCDDEFDEAYEPFVRCGATQIVRGKIEKRLMPVEGFKNPSDEEPSSNP